MKKRHKVYLKINIVSLFFLIVSFSSVTLAWFAYSGLSKASMDVNVKGWYIELEKNGKPSTNDIAITFDDIYPGMNPVTEYVTVKNQGDYDASVKYSVISAKLLNDPNDNYEVNDKVTSESVIDKLSHDYPFHINMSLSKHYILSNDDPVTFEVSISWPLDSGDNVIDSSWGNKAYLFQTEELRKKKADSSYQKIPSIQVMISLTAEQYINDSTSSDPKYNLGDTVLVDVINNTKCSTVSTTCLETHVIDKNSTIGDETVTLLPTIDNINNSDVFNNYQTSLDNLITSWAVPTRSLLVDDILNIVSLDVVNSIVLKPNISDSIIGDLTYNNRLTTELSNTITSNGYYEFLNSKYSYLTTNNCYYLNSVYKDNKVFAITKDSTNLKLYGIEKETQCNIIPIILMNKDKLK